MNKTCLKRDRKGTGERHRKEEKRQNWQTTYDPSGRRKKVKIGNYEVITIDRQAEGWVKRETK